MDGRVTIKTKTLQPKYLTAKKYWLPKNINFILPKRNAEEK